METRTCSKCKVLQPIENYYVYNKTGYVYTWCKKCHYKTTKLIRKQWVEDYPEKARRISKITQRAFIDRQVGGVYLMETTKGIYIGEGKSIPQRLQQHLSLKMRGPLADHNAEFISLTILEEVDDKKERVRKKMEYIELLQPSLNKQIQ